MVKVKLYKLTVSKVYFAGKGDGETYTDDDDWADLLKRALKQPLKLVELQVFQDELEDEVEDELEDECKTEQKHGTKRVISSSSSSVQDVSTPLKIKNKQENL